MKPSTASVEATTLLHRTYKYRIYPNRQQVTSLEEQLAFCCDLYNAAIEQRQDSHRRGRKVTLYDQTRELTALRAEGAFPAGMNCEAQRTPLRRLDRAFAAFFRRCQTGEKPGYPRFRSKRRYNSLTWPMGDGAGLGDGGRLRLQGVGVVKVKWHRPIPKGADVRTVTVRRSCGKWYVCFSLELPTPNAAPHKGPDVGFDLGVVCFARLSTGEALKGPRAGSRTARKVKRLQRKVARCKRASRRRQKAVVVLAKAREHEANVRRDHRHKLAYELVRHYSVIYVEALQIEGLTRAVKGTVEAPGKNARQKAGLNREIRDQAWGQFLSVLENEAEEAGSRVVKVPARYTSQTCAKCGVVDARSRVSQALFICVACGHTDHADTNAAQVIQGLGRSLRTLTWPSGASVVREAQSGSRHKTQFSSPFLPETP